MTTAPPDAPKSFSEAGTVTGTGTYFGHPKGLAFLFGTEMWERFSYYGMRTILIYYMVKYLFLNGNVEKVAGFHTVKSIMEFLYGPQDVQPLASNIYGWYTGLVYLTPLFGGILADRYFGQRKTVYFGAILMAAAEFMLTFDSLFFFGLLLLIIGNGAFKPNMSTQVGGLYKAGDPRLDRAYSIFYVGINVGATFSPLICGTLGEAYGWHYGYAAAGVGMLIGLGIYAYGQRHLPPDELTKAKADHSEKKPLTHDEKKAVLALIVVSVISVFFWACYEQQGNTIALWADENTDRTLNLLGLHWDIPATWFQSINPLFIFMFTPFLIGFWARQQRRGTEPSTVMKMAIGFFLLAASNLVMVAAAYVAGPDKASWLWLMLYFVVITMGELYLSPIGLSLTSKVAPARMVSMMMGVWLGSSFIGNILQGYLGSFWTKMDKPAFFMMIAAIAAVAGLAMAAFNKPLKPMLDENRVRN
jgi:POT family proton-dependent oligopeptide transporter